MNINIFIMCNQLYSPSKHSRSAAGGTARTPVWRSVAGPLERRVVFSRKSSCFPIPCRKKDLLAGKTIQQQIVRPAQGQFRRQCSGYSGKTQFLRRCSRFLYGRNPRRCLGFFFQLKNNGIRQIELSSIPSCFSTRFGLRANPF